MLTKYCSFRFKKALHLSTSVSKLSLRSRNLRVLTSCLTLLNRNLAPSIARIPSVRSSPESISLVLISRGPLGSSSFELSHGAQNMGQQVAGSGLEVDWIGQSSLSHFGYAAPLGLLSNFLERIERDFSTTCIFALHSLIVSSAGSDILCKLSDMLVSYDIFDATLLISP